MGTTGPIVVDLVKPLHIKWYNKIKDNWTFLSTLNTFAIDFADQILDPYLALRKTKA